MGLLDPVDEALQQMRFGATDRSPSGEIVLVEIDAASLSAVGIWPWPRQVHGEILDRLMTLGAAEVVFDIDFSSASNPQSDSAFEMALERAGGYAFLAAFRQQTDSGEVILNQPLPQFAQHAGAVLVNVDGDGTGLLRSVPAQLASEAIPSVALALSSQAHEGSNIIIDFGIDLDRIVRIPAVDLLQGRVDPALLANKQVVVGASALELRDFFRVPRFGVIPGPLVQIAAAETVKADRALHDLGTAPADALLVLGGIAFLLLWRGRASGRLFAIVIVMSVAFELVAWLVLRESRLLLDTEVWHVGALGFVMVAFLEERARRWRDSTRQQARLAYLARHDVSTGALLRHALIEDLDRHLSAGGKASLILVQLERLGSVNASLGHDVADALAAQAVSRLRDCLSAQPARMGNDVFALPVFSPLDTASCGALVERIAQVIDETFEVNGHRVILGARIGTTDTTPQGAGSAANLLRQAEVALSTATRMGMRHVAFAPEQAQEIEGRRVLDLALRKALVDQQFFLLFQPQVDLRTGAMVGVEALVRWQSPELGLVSPADFIPLAEETGLIVQLGEWIMREACRQAAQWSWSGKLSVNVSSIQFRLGNVLEMVRSAVEDAGIPFDRLDIEITESVLIQGDAQVQDTLEALQALGVGIALDDFGTGYSSLSYLTRLPINKIKIDQSFVRSLPDAGNEAIIATIVMMAHRLGKTVIAEGVELELQKAYLARIGCEVGQGYLFARPSTADALGLCAASTDALVLGDVNAA